MLRRAHRPSGRMRRLALLALTAIPVADGWVTISQSYWGAQISDIKDQMGPTTRTTVEPVLRLGYLWSEPTEQGTPEGLGDGITWAFDESLCDNILQAFSEQPFLGIEFVSCSDIQAAVHRGFAAWSDNSAKLTFLDVTEECRRIGQLNINCPLAEIFITWLPPPPETTTSTATGSARQLVAEDSLPSSEAMSSGGQTAALARSFPSYSNSFRRCVHARARALRHTCTACGPPPALTGTSTGPGPGASCYPSPITRHSLRRVHGLRCLCCLTRRHAARTTIGPTVSSSRPAVPPSPSTPASAGIWTPTSARPSTCSRSGCCR